MNTQTATEYRNLPLNVLTESTTNPRRVFEDAALKELAESIRVQGVLSPLLVRPTTEQGFELVPGARRYRAAQMPISARSLSARDRLLAIFRSSQRDVKRATGIYLRDIDTSDLYSSAPQRRCSVPALYPRFSFQPSPGA